MKKRLLAFLLSFCLVVSLLPTMVIAEELPTAVDGTTLGVEPLTAHEKGTENYDVVLYCGISRPFYVMDKNYDAGNGESGVLMLSQYVTHRGLPWGYEFVGLRPQSIPESMLPTFLNGGEYPATVHNLAKRALWSAMTDIQYTSYFLRYETNVAVEGVSDYYERVSEQFTAVEITAEDWAENLWYVNEDGKYAAATGSFDENETYYRDDAEFQRVETPNFDGNNSYFYFKPETNTALNGSGADAPTKNMAVARYYVAASIPQKPSVYSRENCIIVSGKTATNTENSYISGFNISNAELEALIPVNIAESSSYSVSDAWMVPDRGSETTRRPIVFTDTAVNNEKIFSLSAAEVEKYFGSVYEAATNFYSYRNSQTHWWLRSFDTENGLAGYYYSANNSTSDEGCDAWISSTYVDLVRVGIRPAFVLDPEKVLMVSDASSSSSGKDAVGQGSSAQLSKWVPLYSNDTSKWNLTLIDDADLSVAFDLSNATVDTGTNTVSLKYSGAKSSFAGYHYISAFIEGVGYTRLQFISRKPNNKSGDITIQLPETVNAANCKIKLFLENSNGYTKSDFATTPVLLDTGAISGGGDLSVDITGGEFTYDGQPHSVKVSNADGCTLTYSLNGVDYSTEIPAVTTVADGLKTVYVKASKQGSEDIVRSAAISVKPRTVAIQWPSTTSFQETGEEHSVIPVIGNLVAGEDVSFELAGNRASAAGSYTAEVTGLSGDDKDNYVLPSEGTTQKWSIAEAAEETKSFKILLIGNSLSEDARTFMAEATAQYPFLADAEIEFGSLYQGGRSIGYFANCARREKGDTASYDTSYYLFTNDRNKNQVPEPEEGWPMIGSVEGTNGYGDGNYNFCEYYKWDNERSAWVNEKTNTNWNEPNIQYAMNQEDWDIVLIEGFYCDFFGENYESTGNSKTYTNDWSKKQLQDNLSYLVDYLKELQSDVKIGFYFPTVHHERQWTAGYPTVKVPNYEGMYADMMARQQDIESWGIVDFFVSGATAMENAKTTYLGAVTNGDQNVNNSVSPYSKDRVLPGLRRDSIHASHVVGRELLGMTVVETLVREMYSEEGGAGFTPIQTLVSPTAGTLPTEYAEILHAAVEATSANPYEVTQLSDFSVEDPAITAYNAAKAAQMSGKSYDECIEAAKDALSKEQREDLKITQASDEGIATFSFTYGYTTSEVLSFYAVTVTDGKATVGDNEIDKAAAGTTVTLAANAAPAGKAFDKWVVESGSVTLEDASNATTTFTMPAGVVSVKATYVEHTHIFDQNIMKETALKTPADCTQDAVYFKSCSCEEVSTTETFIAENTALEHEWSKAWSSNETDHWKECSRCHDQKDGAQHTASDWIVDIPATNTAAGTQHKECTDCGYIMETGIVPPTGSDHTHLYGSDWNFDSENHWKECSCGKQQDRATHSFKWVIDKEATATEKGSKHEECEVCGYKRLAVEIPAGNTLIEQSVSSQTGDNSSLLFWFVMLCVGGFSILGVVLYCKKKKVKSKK